MISKSTIRKIKRELTVAEFEELITALNTDPVRAVEFLRDVTPDLVEKFIDDVKQTLDDLYDNHGPRALVDKNFLVNDPTFNKDATQLATLPLDEIEQVLVELSDSELHDEGIYIAKALTYLLKRKLAPSDYFMLANKSELRNFF